MYRHYRIRYRRYGADRGSVLAAATAGVVLVLAAHSGAGHKGRTGHTHARTVAETRTGSRAARVAIGYAKSKLGDPYVWAATGPDAFDCSGLVMTAYASAGVHIPRVSWDQWYGLHHVSHPRAGDLVFAPGGDGTWGKPGHVGMFIGHGKVIQAYAPGTPIEVSTLAEFSSGAGGIVGYARP